MSKAYYLDDIIFTQFLETKSFFVVVTIWLLNELFIDQERLARTCWYWFLENDKKMTKNDFELKYRSLT